MAYKVVDRRSALRCPLCNSPLKGVFQPAHSHDSGATVCAVRCVRCEYIQPIVEFVVREESLVPGVMEQVFSYNSVV